MKNSYIDLFSSYKKVKYFKKYFGIKKMVKIPQNLTKMNTINSCFPAEKAQRHKGTKADQFMSYSSFPSGFQVA